MNVYNRALGIKLPRNSAKQQEFCTGVSRNELSPGDLVFFSNNSGRINHVGMYIGAGNMIHASSSRGVIISSLSEKYFMDRFHSAGRVDQYFAMLRKAANPDVRSVPSPDRPIPSSSELQASVDTRTSVKSGVMRGVEVSQDVKAVHFAPAQVPRPLQLLWKKRVVRCLMKWWSRRLTAYCLRSLNDIYDEWL